MGILDAQNGVVHPALDFRASVCELALATRLAAIFNFLKESFRVSDSKSTKKICIVGEQAAAARRLLKIDLTEFAAATGLTQATIINFEGGKNVRPETVEAIREALTQRGIVFTNGEKPGLYLDRDKAIV